MNDATNVILRHQPKDLVKKILRLLAQNDSKIVYYGQEKRATKQTKTAGGF